MTKIRYLAIQSSYQTTDIALFENHVCLEQRFFTDLKASSHLIPHLDSLIKAHHLALSDFHFITVDKGPGAFTTLRVTIATINGIAFAHTIPLIGVNGLEAVTYETIARITTLEKAPFPLIVTLLNAYNNDVYFMISSRENEAYNVIESGCKKINFFLQDVLEQFPNQEFLFTGNASLLHKELIMELIPQKGVFIDPLINVASALTIGKLGFFDFQAHKNMSEKIAPNYIKTQLFSIKK